MSSSLAWIVAPRFASSNSIRMIDVTTQNRIVKNRIVKKRSVPTRNMLLTIGELPQPFPIHEQADLNNQRMSVRGSRAPGLVFQGPAQQRDILVERRIGASQLLDFVDRVNHGRVVSFPEFVPDLG